MGERHRPPVLRALQGAPATVRDIQPRRCPVGHELGELLLVSRCDLLLTGMLHGFEDYAEVPPLDEDGTEAQIARELLHWALAGAVPERYRQYAQLGQLLTMKDIDLLAAIAQDLRSGMHGQDLADFGSVLLALAGRPHAAPHNPMPFSLS